MDKNYEHSIANDKQKKKRRPRSAAGERNYLCGCGKVTFYYQDFTPVISDIPFFCL